jgi:hypothetical protein
MFEIEPKLHLTKQFTSILFSGAHTAKIFVLASLKKIQNYHDPVTSATFTGNKAAYFFQKYVKVARLTITRNYGHYSQNVA